jgi:hypothetical protein
VERPGKFLIVVLCALFATASVYAETDETDQGAAPGGGFGLGAAIGVATLDGISYTRIVMQPRFDFGDWGFEFDVNLEFDKNWELRPGEWDSWQAVLNKLKRFWVGEKGETFFLNLGSLRDVHVGHGTIMGGFANDLFYPDVRMVGIQLDIDFGAFGFESFVENFLDYDIVAGRVYFRPLHGGEGFFSRLEFGATLAADFDPANPVASGSDKYKYADAEGTNSQPAVYVYGVDVGLPLPDLGLFSWTLFFDYMKIGGKGTGIATGFYGKLVGILNWRLEFDRFGKQFMAPFFEEYYLAGRNTRYTALDGIVEAYNGWKLAIWRSFSIVGRDDLSVRLQYAADDNQDPWVLFELRMTPDLLFNKMHFTLTWTRKNIKSFADAFKIEGLDSVAGISFGYMIAPNVMLSVDYTRSFIMDEASGVLVGNESTVIQTQLRF